jgi:pimeloyl-ACP methyl ester carboxylesterase
MRRRTVCFLSLLALAIGAAVASVALGAARAVPNLPGTCTNPGVTCKLGASADGSQWKIEVPPNWNGTLLLYSHGYVPPPPIGPAFNPPVDDFGNRTVADYLLGQGFALAGSGYASTGWAVQDALRDQLDVLAAFQGLYGKPQRTIAWGHSMGGMITAGLLQRNPDRFDGGLPMCGIVGGAIALWNQNLDLEFALKQLLSQADNGPAVSGPASQLELVNIQNPLANLGAASAAVKAAEATPQGQARLTLASSLFYEPGWFAVGTPQPAPTDYPALAQNQIKWVEFQLPFIFAWRAEIEGRAGGNLSWNTGVDYSRLFAHSPYAAEVRALYASAGLNLENDLNAIQAGPRVSENRDAAHYGIQNISYNGVIADPVLTMHTTADGLVVIPHERSYRDGVVRAGNGRLLAQLFVDRPGHCTFTGGEQIVALQQLLDRLDTGTWHGTSNVAALNAAAAALGPPFQLVSGGPGAPPVEQAPAFIRFEPPALLRPFVTAPGGDSTLP